MTKEEFRSICERVVKTVEGAKYIDYIGVRKFDMVLANKMERLVEMNKDLAAHIKERMK